MGKTRVRNQFWPLHSTSPGSTRRFFSASKTSRAQLPRDGHPVDHLAVDVQGIAADGRPRGQGKTEVAFGLLVAGVGERHRGTGLGQEADNADPYFQPHQAQRLGLAVALDDQGGRGAWDFGPGAVL